MSDFIVMMFILYAIYVGVKCFSKRSHRKGNYNNYEKQNYRDSTPRKEATGCDSYDWAEQCRLFREQMQRGQDQAFRDQMQWSQDQAFWDQQQCLDQQRQFQQQQFHDQQQQFMDHMNNMNMGNPFF